MLKDLANQEFDCLHTHEQDLSPYAGSHYPLDEEILVIDTGDQSPGYVLACYPYARVWNSFKKGEVFSTSPFLFDIKFFLW